jgi:hypothetical protein
MRCRLKHGRRVQKRFDFFSLRILDALDQGRNDGLTEREVARGAEGHNALPGDAEDMKLAEGRDIVEPRVGSRVRDHDKAVTDQNPATIRHDDSKPRCRQRDIKGAMWRGLRCDLA